jgi:putative oxidoreductase
MKLGLALIRIVVGTLFAGHGLQKLTGRFGGHGITGTGEFFESLGLRPGKQHAIASGLGETAGGALLALGLFTPLGSALISGSMITAIRKVHAKNGVWASNGGFEYNLVLLGVVFAVTDVGPGVWSLDEALGITRRGPGWAIAELAAGAAGSSLAIAYGERETAAARAQTQPTDAAAAVDGRPAPVTSTA